MAACFEDSHHNPYHMMAPRCSLEGEEYSSFSSDPSAIATSGAAPNGYAFPPLTPEEAYLDPALCQETHYMFNTRRASPAAAMYPEDGGVGMPVHSANQSTACSSTVSAASASASSSAVSSPLSNSHDYSMATAAATTTAATGPVWSHGFTAADQNRSDVGQGGGGDYFPQYEYQYSSAFGGATRAGGIEALGHYPEVGPVGKGAFVISKITPASSSSSSSPANVQQQQQQSVRPTDSVVVSPFFPQSGGGHFSAPFQPDYPVMIHQPQGMMYHYGFDYDGNNNNITSGHGTVYPLSPALSGSAQSPPPPSPPQAECRDSHSSMPPQYHHQPYGPFPSTPVGPTRKRGADGRYVSPLHPSPRQPPPPPPAMAAAAAKDKQQQQQQQHQQEQEHEQQQQQQYQQHQRCTFTGCGRIYKDLRAHMLTHQNERPEKCPIQSCEYHVKGFARKYDKNRHTLTHYKGTMVCDFCPGSGSAAEKSFNRADVFKRHLTAVHSVEQYPPSSRRRAGGSGGGAKSTRTPDATDAPGRCSTCSHLFASAQDFYEHLDDCVLRIVQQVDPTEAINARCLAEVDRDRDVAETLEKNRVPIGAPPTPVEEEDDGEKESRQKKYRVGEMDEAEFEDEIEFADEPIDGAHPATGAAATVAPPHESGCSPPDHRERTHRVQKPRSRGLTHSRGGVSLIPARRASKKNVREYPSSWGFAKAQMTLKKRVITTFDGPRRLAKDDLVLSTDHEVRIGLADGKSYVTDLDMFTLRRAEGFHGATEAEKGPWVSDDPTDEEKRELREMLRGAGAGRIPRM